MIPRDDLGLILDQLNFIHEGAEVGTYRGDFSAQLLTKWHGQKLYSVDCWQEQPKEVYSDNPPGQERNFQLTLAKLSPFKYRSEVIRAFSIDAAKHFPNGYLDFVYLDANHSYEATQADIHAWGPKVRNGGLLCGDDYTASYPGVIQAVNEFARQMNLPVYAGCIDRVNWFIFYAAAA